ncbi:hypothetical protein Y032_0167g153 [Ancylostoma ceylanicum]|uniref:Uncharacterized protein n=1 Tax=Ancylostoma ceylanicum TaxID=53326 RepID=A0A016SWX0_9BILA|nr:hypothetical protein Y032_0167g153 [Ancylostoma ceylanicum]
MEYGSTVAQYCVGNDRIRIRRWSMGPPWPSSGGNARIRVRRWKSEENDRTRVLRMRMGPPCPIRGENDRMRVSNGGCVSLGQAEGKTPGYGSAMEK